MRKRSAVALLSLCSAIYAADEVQPIFHKCPPPASHWDNVAVEIFGQWLYLQPNGSNLYYAAEAFPYDTSISDPPVSPNWQIFEIDPDYHSGFEVGAKCILPGNDLEIEANWERLHTHDTDTMDVTPLSFATGNMVGPIYDIGPNSSSYKSAKGKAVFEFDEVNLLARKSICFCQDLTLGLDLGLSFARIDQKVTSTYTNVPASTSRIIQANSKYWGVGPQLGLNLNYHLGRDFYFTGSSLFSLYMGQIRDHTSYQSYSPALVTDGVPNPNVQNTRVPTRAQLVPGFEERLGFAYKHAFKCWNMCLSAGYLFQIYLNAVQSMDMLTQALPNFAPGTLPSMGVFAVTFNRTLSNFMLTGPYVSLSFGF